MGNCGSSSKKYSKPTAQKTELVVKPVPTKYTLSQIQLIYEAVLNGYIRKKSIPELGLIFMSRGGKSHISLTILQGTIREMSESEQSAIIKLLEDYFISIGVQHQIYINHSIDNPELYKLYCHFEVFG